jgi:prepilin-type N-terminal cleavage/methylation domain-containing protein
MKKNCGLTLIEVLIVLAILCILIATITLNLISRYEEKKMITKIPQGEYIAEPEAGVVYEKTATDSTADVVIAIPRDKYYTEGVLTRHRVLVKVNNQAVILAPIGTLFMRDNKSKDRIVL